VGFLSRAATRFDRLAREAAADLATVRGALDGWIRLYLIVLALLLVALWDMVFKPM